MNKYLLISFLNLSSNFNASICIEEDFQNLDIPQEEIIKFQEEQEREQSIINDYKFLNNTKKVSKYLLDILGQTHDVLVLLQNLCDVVSNTHKEINEKIEKGKNETKIFAEMTKEEQSNYVIYKTVDTVGLNHLLIAVEAINRKVKKPIEFTKAGISFSQFILGLINDKVKQNLSTQVREKMQKPSEPKLKTIKTEEKIQETKASGFFDNFTNKINIKGWF
jgi:hypothetical protein